MNKAKIYQKKATEIIKESIKSVVYIDEKAWNPFEGIKYDKNIEEHIISKKLYKNLKDQGINLNIHKFKKGEQDLPLSDNKKQYLFRDIDLVLLDWDLNEEDTLNEFSLKLLDDIIRQPHIHFCSIYSSSPYFDEIIQKVVAYFSGYSDEDFDKIREQLEHNDDIIEILNEIDITSQPSGRTVGEVMRLDRNIFDQITTITNLNNQESLIPMAISVNGNLSKPEVALDYSTEIISKTGSEYALIINNTVISVLKKSHNKPKALINNFSKLISSDKNKSFFKLLGLDMQNQFSKYGAFIDPDILNISFNTFMHHRKMMNKTGTKPSFDDFMKNLFIENSKLRLSNIHLEILENEFLDKFRVIKKDLDNNELALMNSFYNGAKIQNPEKRAVNFGDIFFNESDNNFYLCLTPLCDCIIRDGESNTDFKYYFVKGSKLNIKEGIEKGDGGFISYIDQNTCISWAAGEYVKPFQFYIPKPTIYKGYVNMFDWYKKQSYCEPFKYLFSLKQNYAQRIANQAFSHPVRVGVDFVKK
ncbi:response regulator receiver domain [Autumnicola edwardsiae]|uniref:Response regulator receiver domain n=1 Tax=Autumnicola edwardsiae TaxID=3075594 RepID=A0ABU3CW43_9FLAO|nr:response regulator receiver domain [Zunongwangia sp. F297]MDT0650583.1 response regulator receiver domain [Zunongwangia sp. F297]